ncbi:Zn-ribbon domain-containing OB-fold protein [Halohasta litorea]|uniref:Zn-ribbon domain-containing OB-fold protein n=1 Tax=Halohasta litorea TaxID=869891 RepID=A0ABD6D4A4_9EURY|nr:OB-fold domain-containing protein [Halohasta litorea]MEA1930841.1 OB-fold domain-containing protein [Euryarchaeota archaeon]
MTDHTLDEEVATYDEWLDAIEAGEGFYLESPEGHGSLPPRRVCPHSGATDLSREPLSETGTVETYTVVHVGATAFDDDTPYISAIVDFGPVELTGVVRGVDLEAVAVGDEVGVTVETRETTDDRLVVFRPA